MEDHANLTDAEDTTVLELLDRLLNQGVAVCGDLVISVADVDLIYARLQLTLSSVETARQVGWYAPIRGCHPSQREPQLG